MSEILSPQEVVALLDSPSRDHYLGLRDSAMLELLYSSGLKVKELLGLDVEDLFLDMEFLKVRSKRERMVPITTKAVKVLRIYLEEARESRRRGVEPGLRARAGERRLRTCECISAAGRVSGFPDRARALVSLRFADAHRSCAL